MQIGIIGAGNVGTGIGKRLVAKGHAIAISFARTPDKVEAAARLIGGGAKAVTPAEAAAFGDIVLLATPWAATLEAVQPLASALAGKIVWDATNPLKPDMSGLALGTTTSGGETIAAALPGAHVVKAIPPFAELLHSPSTRLGSRRPGVFVCGDDAAARQAVLVLVEDIEADGVDAGPLNLARYTEPTGMLLVQLAYVQGFGARIGAALLKDKTDD